MTRSLATSNRKGRRGFAAPQGLILAAAVAACGLGAVPAAHALPVAIMLTESGYTSQTFPGAGGSACTCVAGPPPSSTVTFGTFTVQASGTGSPIVPTPEFLSNSINVSSAAAGTLFILATETGITSPLGANLGFLSSFTTNEVDPGLTVTETTYVDPGDAAFATTDMLDSATFSGIGTDVLTNVATLPSTYSETEVFEITATRAGSTNDTIEIDPVPEPGSFTILGVGLLGLLGFRGRYSRT